MSITTDTRQALPVGTWSLDPIHSTIGFEVDYLAGSFRGPRVLGPEARLEAVRWEESALRRQLGRTDLVINATTLGLQQSDPLPLPRSLLAPHLMIYDLVYRETISPLLAAAEESGARVANGLTMLLHQGALAFERWFDRPAPLAAMRAALGL